MKHYWKIILGIVLLLFIISMALNYHLYNTSVMEHGKELEQMKATLDALKLQQETPVLLTDSLSVTSQGTSYNETHLILTEQRLMQLEGAIRELQYTQEARHDSWVIKWLELLGIFGAIIAFLVSLFGLNHLIKSETVKHLSTATGQNPEIVKKIITDKVSNILLRKEAKIGVLYQKNSKFTQEFTEVLKLFNIDVERDASKLFAIDGLPARWDDALLREFGKLDVLIIENKCEETSKGKKDAEWDIEKNAKMKKSILQLIEEICPKTAILYYGEKRLPLPKNSQDKKAVIATANMDSQFYGNLNNLLQFLKETGRLHG